MKYKLLNTYITMNVQHTAVYTEGKQHASLVRLTSAGGVHNHYLYQQR